MNIFHFLRQTAMRWPNRPGDRIAIFAPNCAAFVELMWETSSCEFRNDTHTLRTQAGGRVIQTPLSRNHDE